MPRARTADKWAQRMSDMVAEWSGDKPCTWDALVLEFTRVTRVPQVNVSMMVHGMLDRKELIEGEDGVLRACPKQPSLFAKE